MEVAMKDLDVRTFDQHVDLVSQISPYGLVLDWGRRLEIAKREYCDKIGASTGFSARACESRIAQDSRLRPGLAATIRFLRERRNAVAHEPHASLATEEATAFAHDAFRALGELGRIL